MTLVGKDWSCDGGEALGFRFDEAEELRGAERARFW